MSVEILIYSYMFICVSMIIFNIVCILIFNRKEKNTTKRKEIFYNQIKLQIRCLRENGVLEDKQKETLKKNLKRINKLVAFDEALTKLQKEDAKGVEMFLTSQMGTFTYLMSVYKRKEKIKLAYYAYLMAKFKVCREKSFDSIKPSIKQMVIENNLYCRENALKALYSFGDAQAVAESLLLMDNSGVFHHIKLITDGLLTFEGNHETLISILWNDFEKHSPSMQVAILNYIRFKTGNHCSKVLEILKDKKYDDEVRYSAIRYFGRYYYKEAYYVLINMLLDTSEAKFNYAVISATALGNYPGQETIDALKKALHSSVWYIRLNAAQSLIKLDVDPLELTDILNGNDRYAREILTYCMEEQKQKAYLRKAGEIL